MRRHSIVLAGLLLAAGCDVHHAVADRHSTPTPSASPSSSPTAVPVASGTLRDKRTSFRVRVTGVHTTKSFRGDVETLTAVSGDTFIVVDLRLTNTGTLASALTVDEPTPVVLHARDGFSFGPQYSQYDALGVEPGASRTVVFVFEVPKSTKAASVTVSVPDPQGDLSTVQLKA